MTNDTSRTRHPAWQGIRQVLRMELCFPRARAPKSEVAAHALMR